MFVRMIPALLVCAAALAGGGCAVPEASSASGDNSNCGEVCKSRYGEQGALAISSCVHTCTSYKTNIHGTNPYSRLSVNWDAVFLGK